MNARMLRGPAALVAGLAAVVVAVLLGPPTDAADDVVWTAPAADGWARGPFADARVTSVRLTTRVDGGYRTLDSTGVFVVVGVDVAAHRESAPTGDLTLHTTDGHTYAQRDEFSSAQVPSVDPGFTASGTAVFELPPDRVQGAWLELVPHRSGLLVFRSGLRFPDLVPAGVVAQASVTLDPASTAVTR